LWLHTWIQNSYAQNDEHYRVSYVEWDATKMYESQQH
jgi:hypothetical protein